MSAVPDISDARRRAQQRKALERFQNIAGLPAIDRLVQRGRDPESAHYTLHMVDGREVRIGTIKILWSQSEMSKVLAVTLGKTLPPDMSNSDWSTVRTGLIRAAIEIDETPGEGFADIVRDWLGAYCESAGTDRNGAMASKRPFVENDDIHVHAISFARDIRRQYSATVKERELITALADLGFVRRTMHYTRGGKDSTASYYWAPIDVLDPESSK